MNFKDILKINLKTKLITKRKVSMLLISILLLIFSFLSITFNHTIISYIYNLCHNNYETRTVLINGEIDDKDLETLKKNNHVLSIDNMIFPSSVLISNEDYEGFFISPMNEKDLPKIEYGSPDLSDNGLVCPSFFVPDEEADSNIITTTEKAIDGKTIIGKTINEEFLKKTIENDQLVTKDSLKMQFTFKGFFDAPKYMLPSNTCFTSYNTFNRINSFLYGEEATKVTTILIDDFKNLEEVQNAVTGMGYEPRELFQLDYETVDFVFIMTLIVVIIFLILIYVVINFNIKRDIIDKEKEILLYKSIGYSKKDIIKIYYLEYMTIFGISFLISCLLSSVIIQVIIHFTSKLVLLQLMPITYNYLEYLVIFILGIIYSSIIIILKLKKVVNTRRISL